MLLLLAHTKSSGEEVGYTSHFILKMVKEVYYEPLLLPLILSVAVVIDYSLTFYFAGSVEYILANEFSPTLVYALENGIVLPYLFFMVIFYYIAGYVVLDLLKDSKIYSVGALIILLMSITHVLGGFSWYVLNTWYSDVVFMLSMSSVVITLAVFGYEIIEYISS